VANLELNTYVYDADSGHFVSSEHQRVAEVIQEYDPNLYLMWIPPEKRELDDTQPFAIVHMPSDGKQYVVRRLKEDEVDYRLLAWLWSNDQARKGNDVLGRLEAEEAARKALELKVEMERREETRELATSIVRSPLNWYKHNGKVFK
jgi:hypothetical protein